MWENIKDGSSWITEKLYEAGMGFFYKLASDMATEGVKLITDFIVIETKIDNFFNINAYLAQIQILAISLLVVSIAWEGFKQQAGPAAFRSDEVSVGTLLMKTVFAATCIYFLPWSVTNVFLKINNLLVKMITAGGVNISGESLLGVLFPTYVLNTTLVMIMLVLAIAAIILGIIAGIRYVEIIIIILLAPIVAVSIVRNGEALDVWMRETISVVFTQAVHVLLLQILVNAMGKLGEQPLLSQVISIGVIFTMIKGPQVLRKFVYSTGVGSSSTRAAGSAGRMAAYKKMASAVKPV